MPSRSRFPAAVRRGLLGLTVAVGVLSATPYAARAATSDDDEHFDARVQGYTPNAEPKSVGNGMTWVLLVLMGGACIGVMFMDAKRSHLD